MTSHIARASRPALPTRNATDQLPVIEPAAPISPVAELELASAIAANEPVHDVTRRDQILLLLAAPFAAATVWFAQHR